MLKWPYHPKQSPDAMESLSKEQRHFLFYRTRKNNSKSHMDKNSRLKVTKAILRKNKLELPQSLISTYITKLQWTKQYGTGSEPYNVRRYGSICSCTFGMSVDRGQCLIFLCCQIEPPSNIWYWSNETHSFYTSDIQNCNSTYLFIVTNSLGIKSDTVSTVSPSIFHEVMGPDAMIFVFWMLSFKPTFSLSTFAFIKKRLSSSSLSAIRVVSSAYLRLLIFLPAILIPACVSSSLAFLMMYSDFL